MAKTLKSILISYITLVSIIMRCECDPLANASSIDGFTTDLIDRDSPDSPLYDTSLTDSQRLANARQRSLARARRFNDSLLGSKATAESTISDAEGSYLMQFFMGSPLKPVMAIVDTGSDLTWTQCSPCRICIRQHFPIFEPRKSRSYRLVRCGSSGCASFSPSSECDTRRERCLYSVYYADGSYSLGYVSTETFVFRSNTRGLLNFRNIVFGCGRENHFHVNNGGSGIVGLGGGEASLVTQLGYDKFSYCLIPTGVHNKTSKLHFGADAAVSGGGVVRTPLSERNLPVFYYLTLEAISVGNKRLEFHSPLLVQGGNIVIDSGALLTLLPVNFYDQLEVAIANSIDQRPVRDFEDWRLCYTSAFVMPKITVHFKGADVEWKQQNAFIRVNLDYVCLAVEPMEGLRPIYGNVAQANYLVGYDLTKRTVSFKPTDCARYS